MMAALVYSPETARSLSFGEYVQDPQKIFWYAGRDTRLTDISGTRLFALMKPTNFVSLWHLKAHKDTSYWEKFLKINSLSLFLISPISSY